MRIHFMRAPVVYGIVLTISVLVFLLYIIGAIRYLTDREANTCEMTYMYEYPQFVRISLAKEKNDASEDLRYPRFRLFAYGEGFVTELLRKKHFTGIPVLFIPGNAGSHQQVRSLASVSLRKSLKYRTPFHFDFFSISFDHEYSGLYGGALIEETEYTAKCIRRILSLYDHLYEEKHNKKIILIGHSMGGIIAKGALLLEPQLKDSIASILITLATPHKPIIYPDYTFLNYYQELSNSMMYLKKNGTTVISISGGPRDLTVPSSQAIDEFADLNALSTNIPGVWRSTDHLSILWCRQLILAIIQSLFDSVNSQKHPPEITEDHDKKMKAFTWHFHQRYNSLKKLPPVALKTKVEFPNEESEWIEDIPKQFVWSSKVYAQDKSIIPASIYLLIKLDTSIDTLSVDAIKLKTRDWIFACSISSYEQSKKCKSGWNLSNRTKNFPVSNKKPKKYSIDLDLNEIRALEFSHVVIRISGQTISYYDDDDEDDEQTIYIDSYLRASRYKKFSNLKPWSAELGNLRYHVILDGITDAVSIEFKNTNCKDNTHPHHTMVELIEPWVPGAEQFFFVAENDSQVMKLQTVHSQRLRLMKSQSAELRLSLDPTCTQNIHVQRANFLDRLTCTIRDRWTLMYPILVGLILLSIGERIDAQNEDKTSFTAIIIITTILCVSLNLVIECCVSLVILHIMAIGVCCSVIFWGSVAHNIAVRFLARTITFSTTWSDWILGSLVNQVPMVTAGILLSIIFATCGALPMLLSVFIHYLRLTQTYDDYLEELLLATMRHFNILKKTDKKESSDLTKQHIINQVLLFLFWCLAALPAVPSLLVWAKGFSYSTRLKMEDSVFFWSWVIMVACGTSNWVQISPTSASSYRTKFLAIFLRCLGWISIALSATSNAAHYYWCIPPCLSVVVVLISVNSLQS